MSLLGDLDAARKAAEYHSGGGDCKACQAIANAEPGEVREGLRAALAGTIGVRTLATILREHDIPVSRQVIDKHRKEGHS